MLLVNHILILIFISFTKHCKLDAGQSQVEQQHPKRFIRANPNFPEWLQEEDADGNKKYGDLLAKFEGNEKYRYSLEQYALNNRPRSSNTWRLKQKVRSSLKQSVEKKCKNFFQSEVASKLNEYGLDFMEELVWCGKRHVSKMGHVRKGVLHRKVSTSLQRNRDRNRRTVFTLPTGRISNAKQEEYPWTVYLKFHMDTEISYFDANDQRHTDMVEGRQAMSCTGSIIHKRFVLTAAHCNKEVGNGDNRLLKEGLTGMKLVQTYKDKLNSLAKDGANAKSGKQVPFNAIPTGVKFTLYQIDIYYGNISFNDNGNVLFPPAKKISLDIENSPSGENMLTFPGFLNPDDRKFVYWKSYVTSHIPLPSRNHIPYGLNDIALIFLGHTPGNEFIYTDDTLPVCLPVQSAGEQNEEYYSCGLEYGEQYHVAGYGAVQILEDGTNVSPVGLTRGKYTVRNRCIVNNTYFGSYLIGKATWRQHAETLKFIKNPFQKCGDRSGTEKCVMGIGLGDSGAALLVPRVIQALNNKNNDVEEERITQMAVASAGLTNSFNRTTETGTEVLPYTEWMTSAMLQMWCTMPSTFRRVRKPKYIQSAKLARPRQCDDLAQTTSM